MTSKWTYELLDECEDDNLIWAKDETTSFSPECLRTCSEVKIKCKVSHEITYFSCKESGYQ